MKCKICDSSEITEFFNNPDILNCDECKNSFRLNATAQIAETYLKGIPMPNIFANKLKNKHHFNFIDSNIGFKNIKNILEIGPGDGSFVKYIRKKNKDISITLIEPGTDFAKKLNQIENVIVFNDFIENVKLENSTFDLVIMSHVLEHLEDPKRTVDYIYKNFLKTGSFLYIDIPNKDYELRSINASKVAPIIHLFFFDGVGIKNMLKNIGFSESMILGNKYSTLPIKFIERLEKLGSINQNNKLISIKLKVLNRLSLYFSDFFKILFNKKSKEINLEMHNSNFNNIAVLAKKS